ncbi:MAG: ATP-dependent DNA helicase, partial [Gammaproteobacteria bacterium]
MMSVSELLGQDGPLARHLPGFAPRPQQQEMAERIAAILEEGGALVTEAGTGTGKTLAYLVPALRSGRKIIISTATKTLQEQLYHRDIPLVHKALAAPLRYAMLKGRGNYLCRYRLQLAQQAGSDRAPQYAVHYQRIRAWAARTEQGDIEELSGIPEDSPVWRQVTSSGDNCLGQECPDFSACHVLKARRAAQEADLLVINHHLLFSDMMLKEGGFGEILPGTDGFIIDEAHQLPEIASRFFGSAVSGNQFLELGRDTAKAGQLEGGDMPQLPELVLALEKAVRGMRNALGADNRCAPWQAVRHQAAVRSAMTTLQDAVAQLAAMLEQVAERGKGLENCWQRCRLLGERLTDFNAEPDAQQITWFETTRRGFVLHDTPLEIADTFQRCMEHYQSAWVFTSATLAVGGGFDHFTHRLGIGEAATAHWDSPFDY